MRAKERRLWFTVYDYVWESKEKKDEETRISLEKSSTYCAESQRKMNYVLVKNKPPGDRSIKDLTGIFRVVKNKYNGAIPKKRPKLWKLYLRYRHCSEDLILYNMILEPALDDTPQDTEY